MSYWLVFLGGGLGAALRHGVNLAAAHAFGAAFPYGTFLVNVTGCAVMGALVGWFGLQAGPAQEVRLFLATGVLGGYTTFSAFSLDAVLLWERGAPGLAILYVLASTCLSIAALAAGLLLARQIA